MLSLKECKRKLGTLSSDLPDEEVDELRSDLYAIARGIVPVLIDEITTKNNHRCSQATRESA